MASVTTEQGTQTTFEVTGIERVPENDRAHTQLWDTMWLWWSANSVVATVALGALSSFLAWDSGVLSCVIVVFNVLGVLPVAFLSTLGPKTGLAQMPLSRFRSGFQGAKLPAIFNALACIGWSAVNAVIGSSLIVAWSAGTIPQWAALLFLASSPRRQRLRLLYRPSVRALRLDTDVHPLRLCLHCRRLALRRQHSRLALGSGLALFAGIATFGGAVFGYAVGWSSYAADYTRRQPADTPPRKVFWYAFFGVVVPCVLLEIAGRAADHSLSGGICRWPPAGT